ncbi:MAG: (2,3-dihydroxybenzoyl)adenylate synthase [Agrobacterium sp.]|nr:(2,3-dihydroxybenzoyl)adenylate synthase [Agrobacterium sp.]
MTIEFVRWPEDLARRYRDRGYWIDRPLSDILTRQVERQPDAVALICGDRRFTYADLDRQSSNLAGHLAAAGIGRGDTALVQLPNIAEFYLVFFALMKIGAAPVNALFSHRRLEMTSYAEQIAPKLVIGARAHELLRRRGSFWMRRARDSRALVARCCCWAEIVPQRSLEQWLSSPAGNAPPYAPSAADEVALFQLSGGSTGTPKLIPRTHNDYDYSVRASAEICELSPQTRFLCAIPVAHNYPMSSPGALGVFHAGGTVVMAANPEPLACFDLIEKHGIDMVPLVPPAVALWLQAAPAHRERLKSLKLLQVGGASFAEALARQVPQVLGCALQQVFGMAEGLVNYTRAGDPDHIVFTTQGRPISPDDEIRIVDEDGNDVPEGEAGMLATRGPYTFRGYYRAAEHSARVFDTEGFYYSGDVVQRTPEGYLRVVGRVKDQINRGGEKVASEEVENLILRHPDVTHAALVAMQDELLGEKSCVFVVSRNPALKAPAIRQHLSGLGVADYKLPDRVRFIDAMPLTAVGKIDKKRLRDMLAAPVPA